MWFTDYKYHVNNGLHIKQEGLELNFCELNIQ